MNNSDTGCCTCGIGCCGQESTLANEKYEIPQNLITFFDSLERKGID
jgi:hypothetical protein